MDVEISALLLIVLVAAWTYLPFMPAVCELLELGDCEPVRVSPDSEVDIRHHARGYQQFVDAQLSRPLIWSRADGRRQEGRLQDGTRYLVLPDGDEQLALGRPEPNRTTVVATGGLSLGDDAVHLIEIAAEGPIRAGSRGVYRALLSNTGGIDLGADTRTLRWIDARQTIRVGPRSRLDGRVSSAVAIELPAECRFERLRAPRIMLGEPAMPPVVPATAPVLDPGELGVPVDVRAGRWLVRRNLDVPAGRRIDADLVVTGHLRIGPGTVIHGSVKSGGNLALGHGVTIEGSVVGSRDVEIGEGCRIVGPVLAESTVQMAPGCRIGEPDRLTTITARRIQAAPGSVVHGTLWAHEGGSVGWRTDA